MIIVAHDADTTSSFLFSHKQKAYFPIKRLVGICGSVIGIVFCSVFFWWWIIPINAIVTNGHPFFRQERLGKNKKVFRVIKFRSMRLDANPNLAPSDMVVEKQISMETRFGKFLRKTSLDETMQLVNILLGDMAFIGPRPGAARNEEALVIEREKYNPSAYTVKPGLSGLAQIKLHRNHDPALKAKYDHEYVERISFGLDFRLFVLTVLRVFSSGAR